MTNQEIESLKAGPEIDKLIAEHFWNIPVTYPLEFSTRIEEAFTLVAEKLNQQGFKVCLTIDQDGDCESVTLTAGDSNCPHQKHYDPADGHGYTSVDYSPIQSIKPPLAICHAALMLAEKLKQTEAK